MDVDPCVRILIVQERQKLTFDNRGYLISYFSKNFCSTSIIVLIDSFLSEDGSSKLEILSCPQAAERLWEVEDAE